MKAFLAQLTNCTLCRTLISPLYYMLSNELSSVQNQENAIMHDGGVNAFDAGDKLMNRAHRRR